ncbi:MAG TPA: exodeoxyribonuclease VII large subunit, partial [Candidatus Saccharimonadales bacterium]|nr:exodeoxyribonuclease VII large subunit [Candidatus Saccharimonadales bacterium]
GVKVDVAHVQVQGSSAPDQIIKAIEYFNQQETLPEAIVIIRGGGSADDLAAFNDELLVRAIASSRVPTLVGVGHETDESLADLAADVRAATPSNAAQILVPDKSEIIRAVRTQVGTLLPRMASVIDQQRQAVKEMLRQAFDTTERSIQSHAQQLDSLRLVLSQLDPHTVLARGYALVRGLQKVGQVIEIETNKVILKAEVKHVSKK